MSLWSSKVQTKDIEAVYKTKTIALVKDVIAHYHQYMHLYAYAVVSWQKVRLKKEMLPIVSFIYVESFTLCNQDSLFLNIVCLSLVYTTSFSYSCVKSYLSHFCLYYALHDQSKDDKKQIKSLLSLMSSSVSKILSHVSVFSALGGNKRQLTD